MIQALQRHSWKRNHSIRIATCVSNDFIIIPEALIYRVLTDYRDYNIAHAI